MKRLLHIFVALALIAATSFAQSTKVGGTGATKVGGTGSTQVTPLTTAFNPQTQGTLIQWNDASVLGLSNGASVVTFTDSKTGAPFSWTASNSATRGTYTTNAQNSKSVVTLNGTQFYDLGGSTAQVFPRTIAAIVKVNNLSTYYVIVGPTNNNGLAFFINTTGTIALTKWGGSTIGTSTGTITAGGYHLLVATVDSSNYAFYIDGVAAGSGTHAQTLSGAGTFVGGSATSGSSLDGGIAEIQIYSSILNSGDLSGLHTYSVNKWATP